MDYKELGIGNKINMVRIRDAAGIKSQPKQYVSQLLDLDVTLKKAKVAMPIENKIVVPLEIGDIYRITVYTSNGLYQCTARVLKRYKECVLYVMDIQLSGKLEKYQRREYFRLLCSFNMEHRTESEEESLLRRLLQKDDFDSEEAKKRCKENLDNIEINWNNGEVIDISGGGIRFNSHNEYDIDSVIIIRIPIAIHSDKSNCEFKARVLRCQRKLKGISSVYDVRGEFIDMDNRTRELLVRYIFEEQRKRMKK